MSEPQPCLLIGAASHEESLAPCLWLLRIHGVNASNTYRSGEVPCPEQPHLRQELGSPVTTSKGAGGTSCDLYLLYITGYGNAGKVPIAIAEGAADFFRIGLAEIVLSPTEAVTRNEKKPVWFYQNDALVSVTPNSAETGTPVAQTPTLSPGSASPSPSASLASTPAPSESPTPTDLTTPVWSSPASATPTANAPTGEQSHWSEDR